MRGISGDYYPAWAKVKALSGDQPSIKRKRNHQPPVARTTGTNDRGHGHRRVHRRRRGALHGFTGRDSVGNARFHTQVEWDPATRTCRVHWSNAPAATLRFTQQWFAGEATPIVDLKAEPPRKLSRAGNRVGREIEVAPRAVGILAPRPGGHRLPRPHRSTWHEADHVAVAARDREGFPPAARCSAGPEGLYPLAQHDVNVGYRDGAADLDPHGDLVPGAGRLGADHRCAISPCRRPAFACKRGTTKAASC